MKDKLENLTAQIAERKTLSKFIYLSNLYYFFNTKRVINPKYDFKNKSYAWILVYSKYGFSIFWKYGFLTCFKKKVF